MEEFKKIEDELYRMQHPIGGPYTESYDVKSYWNSIKNNKKLLEWAIMPTKDRWGERDLVNGLAVCECMLIDYDHVDKDIYQKLVNLIYSNKQIARIVLTGYSNGGYSYLLMTLWNPDLKLTEEQKEFAVREATNKIGTVEYEKLVEEYSKKLDEKGITDEQTMSVEFGDSINPVGAKTGNMYINGLFSSLSDTQAHGTGAYDIRYWILRNSNWSLEEKQKLIMDFWDDDELYDERLEEWEWGIINDHANYKGNYMPQLDMDDLYDYTYEFLFKFYEDKETTDRIWEEIEFCKQMHKLRPQQWELEFEEPKNLIR